MNGTVLKLTVSGQSFYSPKDIQSCDFGITSWSQILKEYWKPYAARPLSRPLPTPGERRKRGHETPRHRRGRGYRLQLYPLLASESFGRSDCQFGQANLRR